MPTSQNSVNFIESIRRRFTKMIDCFQSYDENLQMPTTITSCNEQLKMLNMSRSQKRSKRYAIIYIYRIVIQLAPNPQLEIHHHPRTKIKVTPKQNIITASPSWVRSLRNGSFFVIGPQLYNSIPATQRDLGTSQNSLLQQQ